MIRLLFFGLLFYLAFRIVKNLLRPSVGRRPSARHSEEMVRDPHCGTYLPRGDALPKRIDGKEFYFCSPACRDAFRRGGGS